MKSEDYKNKIQSLELENFTCFSKLNLEFSSGINVLIGENGVGKTHVLKVLYALLEDRKRTSTNEFFDRENAIYNYFRIERNEHHLDRNGEVPFNIRLQIDNFSGTIKSSNKIQGDSLEKWQVNIAPSGRSGHENSWTKIDTLFIPSHEIISINKGLVAAFESQELAYDRTIYDLSKKLSANPRKNEALQNAMGLLNGFEKGIGIKNIEERGTEFFLTLENSNQSLEARLVAEGLRKLAQMVYLIKNGSLKKDTILFWDEPETNLNPKYIKIVAQFLQTLAKNGVQIFVATHDYLLAHLLSLAAEYREQTDAPPMKFFGFYKGADGTEIETADTLAGIENNAILDEYAAYYDLEQQLFKQTLQTT